jgi:hypothetical protein
MKLSDQQLQPHEPPEGYRYETVCFKTNVCAVWIISDHRFLYNDNNPSRCIWGFYNTKTKHYHSPVTHKKVGDRVNLSDTSPYSAMVKHLVGLEKFFV